MSCATPLPRRVGPTQPRSQAPVSRARRCRKPRFTDGREKNLRDALQVLLNFVQVFKMVLITSALMSRRTPPTLQEPKMTRPPVVASMM